MEDNHPKMQTTLAKGKSISVAQDLIGPETPESEHSPNHIVVVMDGLKEFNLEPLEWVLKNIALRACCTITLLGVMPWLNIPLSSKTWSEIWTMDVEDLSLITERCEWKSDVKYQKVHQLLELCQKYGVALHIRTEMGYPLRLVVIEQITSLHATLVVFDRHHDRKDVEYYAKKVPYNMVMMNEDGDVDMIKCRSHIASEEENSTPGVSPSSSAPTPKLMISEHLKRILKLTAWPKHAKDTKVSFQGGVEDISKMSKMGIP